MLLHKPVWVMCGCGRGGVVVLRWVVDVLRWHVGEGRGNGCVWIQELIHYAIHNIIHNNIHTYPNKCCSFACANKCASNASRAASSSLSRGVSYGLTGV